MLIRQANESDYLPIIQVLNEWWGGRQMSDLLPRLFFQHFQSTSYLAWEQEERVGVARQLYERFFQTMRENGRDTVRCITSPVNAASIRFHSSMGFVMESGDDARDEIPIHASYDGKGQDRVLFVKKLSPNTEHLS